MDWDTFHRGPQWCRKSDILTFEVDSVLFTFLEKGAAILDFDPMLLFNMAYHIVWKIATVAS